MSEKGCLHRHPTALNTVSIQQCLRRRAYVLTCGMCYIRTEVIKQPFDNVRAFPSISRLKPDARVAHLVSVTRALSRFNSRKITVSNDAFIQFYMFITACSLSSYWVAEEGTCRATSADPSWWFTSWNVLQLFITFAPPPRKG